MSILLLPDLADVLRGKERYRIIKLIFSVPAMYAEPHNAFNPEQLKNAGTEKAVCHNSDIIFIEMTAHGGKWDIFDVKSDHAAVILRSQGAKNLHSGYSVHFLYQIPQKLLSSLPDLFNAAAFFDIFDSSSQAEDRRKITFVVFESRSLD